MTGDPATAPHVGERWQEKPRPRELRTVIDRTRLGYVVYVSGRRTKHSREITVTLENWFKWQTKAVEVTYK